MRNWVSRILLVVLLSTSLVRAGIAATAVLRKSPVDGGVITSGVGWRLDPFGSGKMVWHNGYDIAVPMGTPVYPVEAGTVYFAGTYKGYGEMVVVDHGNGYVTVYGHNSLLKVKTGDLVDCSTVLALSGSSGRSTGPHVHYEMRQIPGYEKQRRVQMEKSLKDAVKDKVDGWVEDFVNGKGGGPETILPDGEGQ